MPYEILEQLIIMDKQDISRTQTHTLAVFKKTVQTTTAAWCHFKILLTFFVHVNNSELIKLKTETINISIRFQTSHSETKMSAISLENVAISFLNFKSHHQLRYGAN